MSLARKVAVNTLVQVGSKIISTILGLIALGIVTRYLGSIGYGQYTVIITFASFFAILADLGLTLVTSQMINKPGVDQQKVLNNLFSFRLLSALVLVGLAPLVVHFFPYSPEIKIGVTAVSVAFFFLSLNQVFVSLFQKYLQTERIAIAEVAGRIVLIIGVVWARAGDYGLTGILVAMIANNLISFILHYILALKFAKVGFSFNKEIWREIIQRSWPLMLTITFNLIYLKADILFLSLMKGDQEVGLYGAAYKVVDVLATIPFLFAGIMLPIMVNRWLSNLKQDFLKLSQRMFDLTSVIVIPVLIGGWFLADPMMLFIAGPEFVASGAILKILLLAIVAVFFSCIFTHIMVGINQQKKLIVYYLLTALTAVPLYYYLIQRWSYYGAAWGTVYSEILILSFSAVLVWKQTSFIPNLTILFKSIMASGFMALGIALMQDWPSKSPWQLLISMLLAIVIYIAFIYWFKGIKKDDLLALAKKE